MMPLRLSFVLILAVSVFTLNRILLSKSGRRKMPENPDQPIPESNKFHAQNQHGGSHTDPPQHLPPSTDDSAKDARNDTDSSQTQEPKPTILSKLTPVFTQNNFMVIFTGVVAAAAIVQDMYSAISRGQSISAALRTAQLAAAGPRPYRNARDWAGWVATGDASARPDLHPPILLARTTEINVLLCISVLLISAALYRWRRST